METMDFETGSQALKALIRERSPLGALRVMHRRLGRIFQIPLRAFHPYVVSGPAANRQVLVSEHSKVRWHNADPVADLLRRGVLVTDGPEHDHYRALMEPSFHPAALPDYSAMMIAQTDRVASQWQDGQIVDMLVEGARSPC